MKSDNAKHTRYNIETEVKFGFLRLMDVERLIDRTELDWSNQTLCEVNDCVVRLGVVKGEFHWHKHDKEDEFFFVLRGRLLVDLEGTTVELMPNKGFTVPRGVLHRTRAPERTAMLMIEGKTVKAVGDD